MNNTTTPRMSPALTVALALAMAVPTVVSAATEKKATRVVQRHETHPAYDRTPSGEAVSTRERRLRRECKGRPNAGACLGYAS